MHLRVITLRVHPILCVSTMLDRKDSPANQPHLVIDAFVIQKAFIEARDAVIFYLKCF
jgi:hypothetical protein